MVIRLICKKRKTHRKPMSAPKINMSLHCAFIQVDIETKHTSITKRAYILEIKMSDHAHSLTEPITLVLNDDYMKFSRNGPIV